MINVDPADHIRVNDIRDFCIKQEIVHVNPESIREWFDKSADLEPYVLVTSQSDFSLRLQAEHHPNADLFTRAMRLNWQEIEGERDSYIRVEVGPSCDPDLCSVSDKYVMKADCISACTFDEVPDNVVKWFCANLDIIHPRIEWMPFGLNEYGPGSEALIEFMGRPKTELCYANFQPNTMNRKYLNEWIPKQSWITQDEPATLPFRKFVERMASCKFVLCPLGNGLDCYRTYEALYLGCIPILEDCTFSRYLYKARLPVVLTKSFYSLTPESLDSVYQRAVLGKFDGTQVTKSYWLKRIASEAAAMV